MAYLDSVLDISHHEGMKIDFSKLKNAGITAVIHKATQGNYMQDEFYSARRKAAEKAGLLWGAYHFGAQGVSGQKQAAYFLDYAGSTDGMFCCLDYERYNHDTQVMSLDDAHAFIDAFSNKVGRRPWFYSGNTISEELGTKKDALLGACKLWLAGYVNEPKLKLQASWKDWTLWQYQYQPGQTSPTHPLPGFGIWDRSYFDGTQAQLAAVWAS
jgi:lysozyme